jgi:hypothetical protein
MSLKTIFLIAAVVSFSACATGRYETYYEAVDPDNSGSLAQASATCVSQANIAANSARASESASQTSGGGFWGGFANGMSVNLAAQNARNSTMRSCMNAYGFTEKRVCVSGC